MSTTLPQRPKSCTAAYLLWLFGLHYLYLRRPGAFLIYILTGGGLLIWAVVDLFHIPDMVELHNYRIADPNAPRPRPVLEGVTMVAALLIVAAAAAQLYTHQEPARWWLKTHVPLAAAAQATPAATAPRQPDPTAVRYAPAPRSTWSQAPGSRQWIEHDPRATTLQSVGGNGGALPSH